ncbi:MAG: hypothetical protein WD379_04940 [Dehalococcoidia bacterium]
MRIARVSYWTIATFEVLFLAAYAYASLDPVVFLDEGDDSPRYFTAVFYLMVALSIGMGAPATAFRRFPLRRALLSASILTFAVYNSIWVALIVSSRWL